MERYLARAFERVQLGVESSGARRQRTHPPDRAAPLRQCVAANAGCLTATGLKPKPYARTGPDRADRRGNVQNAGEGSCDGSAVVGQVSGGPIGGQRVEGGQATLGTIDQMAEVGDGQFDHRTVALLSVDSETGGVAETLRKR
ncbi:hypothetical protein ABZ695_34435 [Streptomyces sp. NPDC006976]|uniref:hypothetical protein n=1 Tax=Streptomyces sp. NPDC006976 TaxID=3154311 RepID=UPI003407CFCF